MGSARRESRCATLSAFCYNFDRATEDGATWSARVRSEPRIFFFSCRSPIFNVPERSAPHLVLSNPLRDLARNQETTDQRVVASRSRPRKRTVTARRAAVHVRSGFSNVRISTLFSSFLWEVVERAFADPPTWCSNVRSFARSSASGSLRFSNERGAEPFANLLGSRWWYSSGCYAIWRAQAHVIYVWSKIDSTKFRRKRLLRKSRC